MTWEPPGLYVYRELSGDEAEDVLRRVQQFFAAHPAATEVRVGLDDVIVVTIRRGHEVEDLQKEAHPDWRRKE
jgi:hypothetical protein